jgi:hypothetical protein
MVYFPKRIPTGHFACQSRAHVCPERGPFSLWQKRPAAEAAGAVMSGSSEPALKELERDARALARVIGAAMQAHQRRGEEKDHPQVGDDNFWPGVVFIGPYAAIPKNRSSVRLCTPTSGGGRRRTTRRLVMKGFGTSNGWPGAVCMALWIGGDAA